LPTKRGAQGKRAIFLKIAFMATLKGQNALGGDDAMARYQEHLARVNQRVEEARQTEESIPELDEEAEKILGYFQTTPYRTKGSGVGPSNLPQTEVIALLQLSAGA
jgi:hypothetical protein